MKKFFFNAFIVVAALLVVASCGPKYETVPGDPTNTKIYTLSNGLKVYMHVNKDEPTIKADIAVKVGAKNDPAETTGLAHYFEHLMFKGTKKFGTSNYAAEEPLLDRIEQEFERYRTLTDEQERKDAYRIIDSLSYLVSAYSIPNEYDKLMAAIGSSGTNAYTGYDQTVYVEEIPSNQVEAWAKIQADRFENNVIRLFHTELETVYEEKNMSLTNDGRRALEAMLSTLYPSHPYGTQTVLGTQEHLKNPSITNIKKYHETWYVPNNIAICLSGDFNPDKMVAIIEKYFGHLKPNNNLPKLEVKEETPFAEAQKVTIVGQEAPFIYLAWRAPGAGHKDFRTLGMISQILSNAGGIGLLDVNVNNKQLVLGGAGSGIQDLADHSMFLMMARPKTGQTLDEVKDILMSQVELLKKGDFDADILTATINNFKKSQMLMRTSNSAMVDSYVNAFINGQDWKDCAFEVDEYAKVTKEDIVRIANEYLVDNGMVAIYKEQGERPMVSGITKPQITAVQANRDNVSDFLADIQKMASEAKPIEPEFVDFNTAMSKREIKEGVELLYVNDNSTDVFNLSIAFEKGSNSNPLLSFATSYVEYLGTDSKTLDEINKELYIMASSASISVGEDKSYISISGLKENLEATLKVFEDRILNAVNDEAVAGMLKAQYAQMLYNSKSNQRACNSMLTQYVMYGPQKAKDGLTYEKLVAVKGEDLLGLLKDLFNYSQQILYSGPHSMDEVATAIANAHLIKDELIAPEKSIKYPKKQITEKVVYIAPYEAEQIYMGYYANKGEKYDFTKSNLADMYNAYFGSGMNAIVFQEMREARGLAYSAGASYVKPYKLEDNYYYRTSIATQNDKMMDAIRAFDEIINNMPESEAAFKVAKESLLTAHRTLRQKGMSILRYYQELKELGLDKDVRKDRYQALQGYTLQDIVKFQQENVKDGIYAIGILGDKSKLDIKSISSGEYGKVVYLTLEDIFGY